MDDATLTHAFARVRRIQEVGNGKERAGDTYARQLMKDLKRLTHESTTRDAQNREVCEACGAGEGELYEKTCDDFTGSMP